MSVPKTWTKLIGTWSGANRLWLSPDDPVRECETAAAVAFAARDKFLSISYTWAFEGEPQEGLFLVGFENDGRDATGVWIDSWHMGDKSMVCRGTCDAQGVVSVTGSYSAPTGPDWGWRTVFEAKDGESFRMVMYNVPPGEAEQLAVEAVYARRGATPVKK
jgi:hypothetical protein